MRYLKVLILFFSFSILFEMTTTSVNAADCTITDGEFSETEIKSDCATLPAKYEIIVYEDLRVNSQITIQKISSEKNFFILLSIFTQILSLLFLLFLFRSIINNKL